MSNIWKLILLGIAGLVLAGAAIGIVAAQDNGTSTPKATDTPGASAMPSASNEAKNALRDQYLSDLAKNLGVSQDKLTGALKQTALDVVDQAVADGKLTEDQATKIRDKINSGEAPFFGFGPGFGPGFDHGFAHGIGVGARLEDIATFLGVNVSDITSAFQNNQSLADVAQAHGKTADELAAFLLDQTKAKLADAVTNGDITQARADEVLAGAPDRINQMINRTGFQGPHGGRGFRFGGPDGDQTPPDGSATPEASGTTF